MDIERLINRHKDSVYRQMVRVCGNHDDAEDALATALVSALGASGQLRDPQLFQAWLSRIASRACSRMKVREGMTNVMSLTTLESFGIDVPDQALSADAELQQRDLKNCVLEAVKSLPDILREVYIRRDVQGQSNEQVAEVLGLTLAATKSRLHRAREHVRTALDTSLACNDARSQAS